MDQLIDVFGENVKVETLDLSYNYIKQIENSQHFLIFNINLNFNVIKLMHSEYFKGRYFSEIQMLSLDSNELIFLDRFLLSVLCR